MIGTKEADLMTATLLYAMRCLAEDDQLALRGMRFGAKEIGALRTLSVGDLYRAGTFRTHCLNIELDRDVFWPMMAHLQATRNNEEVMRDLVKADAPQEMVQALFGIGAREYTRLRRMLSMEPAAGRPPEPDETTSHTLWRAWQDRQRDSESVLVEPADYLALHQETGTPLRAIWLLMQRWLTNKDGAPPGSEQPN